MRLDSHYDEEVLAGFLADDMVARRDPHLTACPPCAGILDSLRYLAGALHEEAVWDTRELDETPRQSTIDFLRARQAELSRETEAARYVSRLVQAPFDGWRDAVAAHPPAHAVQTVVALVAEAERIVFAIPPEAIVLCEIAVELSEGTNDALAQSAAWRELGYCLYFTGRYPEAVTATEKAQVILGDRDPLQAARISLQHALIAGDMGQHETSRTLARASAQVFAKAHDVSRYVAAKRTEGIAFYKDRRYREAIRVFEGVREEAGCLGGGALAGLLQNMALCHRELGELDRAVQLFLRALDSFERLGQSAQAAKARWHLGRVFLAQGRLREALVQLRSVEERFRGFSMAQDVALVTVDIAQVLAATGDLSKVSELCRQASEYFVSAGLSRSEGALTALALIREAADTGHLSDQMFLQARAKVEKRSDSRFAFIAD
jgi:tetratricopeptide (TPR) repeat protein